ncbi:TPR/MLP1/MLP2-like protein-domain-containing protein [Chiua virens]|nr:TPR/MLP1/MLP2-like protein-domain-containing protein [Chiua virens]KAG9317948.1 TPR/MLP1/MLP2-like protein-domain-containing protein [Chiua virens]
MANVQRMHNDLERSGENDRRRLETQVQMENQTQDLKTQLSQERETIHHVTLQRGIDMKDLQPRLDKAVCHNKYWKLLTMLTHDSREALLGAETSKTHLQERVDDLARQLQGNAEKLAVYERRTVGTGATASVPDPDLSREQQLEQEVADLCAQLKVAQRNLAAARNHMQQFQEISQANEAALTALNTTHEYKADAKARLARHELECESLEEKLRSVQQEVQQWTNKFNDLQKTLEDTIVDMSTLERNSEGDQAVHEREMRALEQRAVAAEGRYSREVVAHAESFKTIENLKQQLDNAQATSRQNLTRAANAQAKLEALEGSWKQQKDALDKEIVDLNGRCKDLAAQNTLLHQHLGSVGSQAARIRQVADSAAESTSDGVDAGSDVDTKLSVCVLRWRT